MWKSRLANVCHFSNAKCQACAKTSHIAKVCQRNLRFEQHLIPILHYPRARDQIVLTLSRGPCFQNHLHQPYHCLLIHHHHIPCSPLFLGLNQSSFQSQLMAVPWIWNWTLVHPFPSSEETLRYVSKDTMSINLTNISLHTYLGKELLVLETTEVEAAYESQTVSFPLVIVKGQGSSLLGYNWLEHVCLS